MALDLANTVIWKDIETRCLDRLQTTEDIEAFATAALRHSEDLVSPVLLSPPKSKAEVADLTALRDAIDDWLRPLALDQQNVASVAALFKACWAATRTSDTAQLAHACALSATQFFQPQIQARVKVCPTCRWLFLDRSKNRSRRWCDMKVCGNRAKAHQHYHSQKQKAENAA